MSEVILKFKLPKGLDVKEFLLIGKSYDEQGFHDVFYLTGEDIQAENIKPADPVTEAGLKRFLLEV